MKLLSPYLAFNGNCREAMDFYRECLGGELKLMTMGESPMAAQIPAEARNRVMHATLTFDGMVLMASDMMESKRPVRGNRISVCVSGPDKKEIETCFTKMSAGGKINSPLKEEFFGLYGALIDKFGIAWMFQGGQM